MSEEAATGMQGTGQLVQLLTPHTRRSHQTGGDCKADPHGLLGRRERGSYAGLPPPCSWHWLGRHTKTPKIKRTTLPEPSPCKAAGDDTAKGQQEDGRSGYCKHHGDRTEGFGTNTATLNRDLGPWRAGTWPSPQHQHKHSDTIPTQVNLHNARKQELQNRSSKQGKGWATEVVEAKREVQKS